MARQNIFEILKSKFDIYKEINKIILMSSLKLIEYDYSYDKTLRYTVEEFFEEAILNTWKQRGLYLNCDEIKEDLNIKSNYTQKDSFDNCITVLEYYHNLMYLIIKKFNILKKSEFHVKTDFFLLIENMNKLLDCISYELHVIEKEEKVLLIPKNPAATAVAEISSEETALAILMYNHLTYKGNIDGKRNLLYQIALEYEPLLSNPINGFKDYYEKVNGLLNNLHIRHNNQNEEDNKNTIINLDEKELEKWYDELYQLLLFCVLIKDNIERKKEVEEFLKEIKLH